MKTLFTMAVATLISTAALAAPKTTKTLKVECTAAVGSVLHGRPETPLDITYQDGYAYFHQKVSDYLFSGSCDLAGCDFTIHPPTGGYSSTNGSYSKTGDKSVSGGIWLVEDFVAEVDCTRIQ